jgi:hypothetical protein
MRYAVEMATCGMIYTPSFMKTGTGVQAILRFGHRNLRGCNAGIADGWGFMNYAAETGSGAMIYIPGFTDWFNHSEVNKGRYTYRHTDSNVIS